MKINIVGWDNGGGLGHDIAVLTKALSDPKFTVHINGFALGRQHKMHKRHNRISALVFQTTAAKLGYPSYDINIFVERIYPRLMNLSRYNVLIPNPEWVHADTKRHLQNMDLVLCKTRLTEQVFKDQGCAVNYVGFTTNDIYDTAVGKKNENEFIHFAGKNPFKGTRRLLDLWRKRPHWPRLHVFQSPSTYDGAPNELVEASNINHGLEYLPTDRLHHLQNHFRLHLCPTEAEGFGHGIVEAMACEALIITTDAPPMNELVTHDRGILVPYTRSEAMGLSQRYLFDEAGMEKAVTTALAMPPNARREMGQKARQWYINNEKHFARNLIESLSAISDKQKR